MQSTTNALVVHSGAAPVANQGGTGTALVDVKASVPKSILAGIKDVMLAFPAGAVAADADRARTMQIYAEATDGFDIAVATFALQWLKFHNPRNPFPPTPQDVHELCKAVNETWESRVSDHFIGWRRSDFRWGEDPWEFPSAGKKKRPRLPWGPPPLTPGCLIPDELVLRYLRKDISRESVQDTLVSMAEAKFSAIPPEGFPDGVRELILEKRRQKAEAEEKERKRAEYLESLPPDLRKARGEVEHRHLRLKWADDSYEMPSEDEIIAEAKEIVRVEAEKRAKRDAEWEAHIKAKFGDKSSPERSP